MCPALKQQAELEDFHVLLDMGMERGVVDWNAVMLGSVFLPGILLPILPQ